MFNLVQCTGTVGRPTAVPNEVVFNLAWFDELVISLSREPRRAARLAL
jgi:hypothetical protein